MAYTKGLIMKKILVTGNCGYIGSHTTKALAQAGYEVSGIDNLCRGSMSNAKCSTHVIDIRNYEDICEVMESVKPDIVCHFAALTSVPESMERPDEYYEVNVEGTQNILRAMKAYGCSTLIFSSTASVYKMSRTPVKETDVLDPLNNYAKNKLEVEQLIKDNSDWLNAVVFRYFNVIGWDEDYDALRELYKTNIVPALYRASTSNDKINVYGNSFPIQRENPNDHTGVRDYIDVRDIAKAYLCALNYLKLHKGQTTFNLGTKTGVSVLELIEAFNKANGTYIGYEIKEKRKGDPAIVIADSQKANELLHWSPDYTLEQSLKIL